MWLAAGYGYDDGDANCADDADVAAVEKGRKTEEDGAAEWPVVSVRTRCYPLLLMLFRRLASKQA